jgi:hypothetical protein
MLQNLLLCITKDIQVWTFRDEKKKIYIVGYLQGHLKWAKQMTVPWAEFQWPLKAQTFEETDRVQTGECRELAVCYRAVRLLSPENHQPVASRGAECPVKTSVSSRFTNTQMTSC